MKLLGFTTLLAIVLLKVSAQVPNSSVPVQNPACNPNEAIPKCVQPAIRNFMKRYEERKRIPLTDEKWARDLTTQCELDQSGRKCITDFMKHCFPQVVPKTNFIGQQNTGVCQQKVSNITQGCTSNSSKWYSKCEEPMVAKLYAYLTTNPADPTFNIQKGQQIHKELCCELKRYEVCISAKTASDCTAPAQQIFRDITKDMLAAYQCDEKTAFANANC
ncbi:uncharacterized protein LOC129588650 [Paramacrobiotus metropolitanus]|uniref:uncharacterized protein LOC129588650 n=1 Tax=Paramacrobiotus metropolitanus TaxID=2943436 RepID=UPI0024457FB9|nr:uncharacterized protein LOC129588650 [Paramacrobiotus metropolitanus]